MRWRRSRTDLSLANRQELIIPPDLSQRRSWFVYALELASPAGDRAAASAVPNDEAKLLASILVFFCEGLASKKRQECRHGA